MQKEEYGNEEPLYIYIYSHSVFVQRLCHTRKSKIQIGEKSQQEGCNRINLCKKCK